MKRIVLCLLLLTFVLTTFCFVPATAAAEDYSYLEIKQDGVCLYENTVVQDVLFILPKTYYVKLIKANLTSVYHLVEYNGVRGLVKAAEVSDTPELNVSNPYYTNRTISANAGQYLYAKPAFAEQTNLIASELTALLYLGKTNGEKRNYSTATWFAVLYANQVYYIHSAMTEDLDLLEFGIPAHPNSAASSGNVDGDETAAKDKDKGGSSVDTVRILLILGMFVPIVIILVVLFRPRKKFARSRSDREAEDDDY